MSFHHYTIKLSIIPLLCYNGGILFHKGYMMPNPKTLQKNKKNQCMNLLQTCEGYILDCLTILEYDPEYVEIYVMVAMSLQSVRGKSDPTPLHVFYEAMPDDDNKIDLGSRYKSLLSYLDLYLKTKELRMDWVNTRV